MTAQPLAVPFFGAVLSDDDKADYVAVAREIIAKKNRHTERTVRDACAALKMWGDENDRALANGTIKEVSEISERLNVEAAALAARLHKGKSNADADCLPHSRWPRIAFYRSIYTAAFVAFGAVAGLIAATVIK